MRFNTASGFYVRPEESPTVLIWWGELSSSCPSARTGHPAWVDSAAVYGQTRTVDVHIAHLRKRLAGSRVGIETITGIGYKLVVA